MSLNWASPLGLLRMSVCVSVCVCERVSPTPAVLDGPGSHCPVPIPLLNGEMKMTTDGQTQGVEYRCHKPYTLRNGTTAIRYTCSGDGTWKDDENRDAPPECATVCGRPTVSLLRHQRIFGGEKAPAGSVPWQVLLTGLGRGGAFVIHDQWLLTAAHNLVESQEIVDKESLKMYVGENSVTKMLNLPQLEVQAVRVHPLYNNPDKNNYDHDIALIQLKRRITFNSRVMPLCLPSADDQYTAGQMGLVSGFGVIENQRLQSDLRFVKLPLVDQKVCEDFASLPNMPVFTENMFCAGLPEGGKDSCSGDSGGAFAFARDGRFWAAGIVSWGVKCGQPGHYGVYTRISKYTDWIHKIIDNQVADCGDPKPLLNGQVAFLSITKRQYLSVIEYQCDEPYYAFQGSDRVRYTCAADGVWRDRNNSDIIPPCVPVCGRPETVKNGSVPWYVSVSVDGGTGAGAAVGARWVLTAASSLQPIGAASTTTRQVKLFINGSAFEVTALHIHPSYNQSNSLTYFSHNIALVELRSPITFNDDLAPLCLPTEKSDRAGLRGLVSAFPSNSSNPQGIWLPLVDNGRCSSSRPALLSAQTLCSGGATSLLSDYMGVALGVEEDGRFGAAGVLIQTVANQEGGSYGVYTRVSQHQKWIRDTIRQHYCEPPDLPNMVELVDHNIRYEQHSELQLQCASKYYSLQGEEKYACAADGVWRSGTGHSVWPTCVPDEEKMTSKSGKQRKEEVTSLTMETMSTLLEEHSKSLAAEFKSTLGAMDSKLDQIRSLVEDHGQRLSSLESFSNDTDRRLLDLETLLCSSLRDNTSKLAAKVSDLEGRSRRQNIRILGLPESTESGSLTQFFSDLLTEVFGKELLPSPPEIDRAHRTPATKPKSGERPRPVLLRLHRFQIKDVLIREARKKGKLTYRGHSIRFVEDYSSDVLSQRMEYKDVMSELYQRGLRPALLYPARLRITLPGPQGEKKWLQSVDIAQQFINEHNTGEENGKKVQAEAVHS